MRNLLITLAFLPIMAWGQSNQSRGIVKRDTLKYQLSKHGQYKEGVTEYTSVFGLGDTATTRYGFNMVIKMIRWRNKKVRFEYFGGNSWFLEGDLKRK